MLHPAAITQRERKVIVKRSRCICWSSTRFGHLNTKARSSCVYVYACEPVGDVMHVYRHLFLTPNMADTTHTDRYMRLRCGSDLQPSLSKWFVNLNNMYFFCSSSTVATSRECFREVRLDVYVSMLTDTYKRKEMINELYKKLCCEIICCDSVCIVYIFFFCYFRFIE